MRDVAGLLLTGGASRRFGVDKATLLLDGERLADRAARVLCSVASPVLEVGPGFSSLAAIQETPTGRGPLAAMVAGAAALDERGAGDRSVVVLAVDLPHVDERFLAWLAVHPVEESVVPVVASVPQVLCARYTPDALATAARVLAQGGRSVRALLAVTAVHEADVAEWGAVAGVRSFVDVDTADEAAELGLEMPR